MDKAWKQFEREAAQLFGGARYWANSGESVDVESETVVAQCKHVKALSLAALTDLAAQAERDGTRKLKAGVVAVKVRRRQGARRTPMLVVMTEATWRYLHGVNVPVAKRPGVMVRVEGEG